MALLNLPSVQVDAVLEDALDATQAVIYGSADEPFDLTDGGGTFVINLSFYGPSVITFDTAQIDDLRAATAEEVVDAINSQLTGGYAVNNGGRIDLYSDEHGSGVSLQVFAGGLDPIDPFTIFGWASGIVFGVDATDQLVIANRNPSDGERGVGTTSDIQFDVFSLPAVFPTDFELWVEGVLAYDGSWQNGWTGSVTLNAAHEYTFVATPPAAWSSTQTIDVQAVAPSVSLNDGWSFRALDTTPPTIADVQGRGKQLLRVTFSEPVKMESAGDSDDALNPANYVIERQSRPAVEVEAVSVAAVDAYTVDVTTDIELTFGAPYLLIVANVADEEGVVFLAPNNAFEFDAFAPPFPTGRRFLLDEFIPEMNKAEDSTEDLRLTIGIIQEVVNVLLNQIDEWASIIDVDEAPERFLDAMLASLGNPFPFVLSEVDKRRLIRVLVAIYQLKGTAIGIIDVVRFFLGIEVTIEIFNGEGWLLGDPNYPDLDTLSAEHSSLIGDELSAAGEEAPESPASLGPPPEGIYTFRVVAAVVLTEEQHDQIVEIAEYMKPAHTHLLEVADATPPPEIDHVELGYSELGSSAPGGTGGLFILHAPS